MVHKWANRRIAHPDHHAELEAAAAAHEFGPTKLSRENAEEHAYSQYKTKLHQEGAGHHLRNLRVAVANGDRNAAGRSTALYKLHLQALGHNANQPAPPEVEDHARKPMTEKMHQSPSHKSDSLLMSGPMSKSNREYLGYSALEKADGAIAPKAPQKSQPAQAKQADTQPSISGSAPAPVQSAAGTKVSAGSSGTISAKEQEAGPQHFDEGSIVKYHDVYGDHHVPPDWIGTIAAHHLIKLHSSHNPGSHHMYEVSWKTGDGRLVDDFVEQARLQPFKGGK